MKVSVSAAAHNEAAMSVSDRGTAWEAWMRENHIPSRKIDHYVFDTEAWTVMVYRLAVWQGGTHDGTTFHGYREASGAWVMDRASDVAREEPETYRYYTDPADWMLACGEPLT